MTNKRFLKQICSDKIADQILAMIAGDLNPREVSDSCDQWVRQCINDPDHEMQVLYAADELLETTGVEGWPTGDDLRSGVSYCNTGDMYAGTLALVPDGPWGQRKFRVSSLDVLTRAYPKSQD